MKAKVKFVFIIIFAFALIVPVGTILHELGHYVVAQFYYDFVTIHKASMTYSNYKFETNESLAAFQITLAGTISTILMSVLGIFLVSRNSFQKISVSNFHIPSGVKTLFAFFISREVLISFLLIFNSGISNSDEYKIPKYLNLDVSIFNAAIFILSTAICFYILNKTVERSSRIAFLFGAAVGCGIGYWSWIGFS